MQETAISLVADGADCVQRPTICLSILLQDQKLISTYAGQVARRVACAC